ncbi:MAG: ABC transporter permease [Pseudomonadota bacterium]
MTKRDLSFNWNEAVAIARREIGLMWSDSRIRSVVFVAPFVYAAIFCGVYINHTVYDLPIVVFQQDHSEAAHKLVQMLDASSKLVVTEQATSMEEVKDLMLSGKVDAAVVIPPEFSRDLKRGHDTVVPAFVNASSMVGANIGGKAINEVVQTYSAGVEILKKMKSGENLATAKQTFMPVKLDLRPMFNPSFNYSNFMVPGLLMAILQQVILLGVALSWTGEFERGTLGEVKRLSSSPLTMLCGKLMPYVGFNFLVAMFYLHVLFPLNDIPMEGSWWIMIPFTLIFILTITTWGMWMSALCKTRLFATQILMFLAMPSFVLSGFTWPAKAMPSIMQAIGRCLPLTYFVSSFRNIYLAAAPFKYVAGDFAMLCAFTAVNLVVAYVAVSRVVKIGELPGVDQV